MSIQFAIELSQKLFNLKGKIVEMEKMHEIDNNDNFLNFTMP